MADKRLNNLKPYKKGERDKETSKVIGRKGGIASGEARRRKADMKKAMEMLLAMPATGNVKGMLAEMGYSEEDQNNANAIAATLFAMSMKGDPKALDIVVNYAFQVSEDERKTKESDARISALGKNGVDLSVESKEDDGGVMIYLPAIEEEEEQEQEQNPIGFQATKE